MAEEHKVSSWSPMNKSVDNKEKTTAKREENMDKHARVIGYLKNTANQEDNTETACSTHPCPSCGEGNPLSEGRPSNECDRLVKLSLEQYLHHPQTLTLVQRHHKVVTPFPNPLCNRPAVKQDNP
jgi:hypothetical protein